jgi:hypothetical protein
MMFTAIDIMKEKQAKERPTQAESDSEFEMDPTTELMEVQVSQYGQVDRE